MRFANPPGLASFMAKNAGYDQIGSQGIKESVDTDLTTMGTMGQAQANALNTIAKDKAAEEMRDARAFGMAQQADARLFGSIASAVGTIGSAGIKKFGSNAGNPFRDPTKNDLRTTDQGLADTWRDSGGDVYWDSDMDESISILR